MKTIEQLQEENAALAAQVEALRVAALNAISFMSGGEAKAQLRDAYDSTPQQHLAEIRADAGRAGFVDGALEWGDIGFAYLVEDSANKYADSIRQGEVE